MEDTSGVLIWGRKLNHLGNNYPFSFYQTLDGGFIMESGHSLIKTDSTFSVLCDTSVSFLLNTIFSYPGTVLNDTLNVVKDGSIDLSNYPRGIYLFQGTSEVTRVFSKKIVLQ